MKKERLKKKINNKKIRTHTYRYKPDTCFGGKLTRN